MRQHIQQLLAQRRMELTQPQDRMEAESLKKAKAA
jgi:hypothetical protein